MYLLKLAFSRENVFCLTKNSFYQDLFKMLKQATELLTLFSGVSLYGLVLYKRIVQESCSFEEFFFQWLYCIMCFQL